MTAIVASVVLMVLSPALLTARVVVAVDRWAARRWGQ